MTYHAHNIGPNLAFFACNSAATSIYDVWATGVDLTTTKAIVYHAGNVTTLPLLPGSVQGTLQTAATPFYSVATSITSDGGKIAGCCSDNGGVMRPVVWTFSAGAWSVAALAEPPAPAAGTLWTAWINYYNIGIGPVGAWIADDGTQAAALYAVTNDPGTPDPTLAVWAPLNGAAVGFALNQVVGDGCAPTPISNYSGLTAWGSAGSAAGTAYNFSSSWTKHTPTTTLPGGHQVGLLTATATKPDGTVGVFTGTDLHDETYVGLFYTGQTSGIMTQLTAPGGAANYGAMGLDTTGYWFCGGGDTGAVLWTAGTPAILPAVAGAAADQSYVAWAMGTAAGVLVGYGNDSGAVLRGVIWDTNAPDATIDYSGKYFMATLAPAFDADTALVDSQFLDAGMVPAAASVTRVGVTLYGLWHLNGKTATAFLCGLDCGDWPVSNGQMAVPFGGAFTAEYLDLVAREGVHSSITTIPSVGSEPFPGIVGYTYTSRGQLLRPIAAPATGAQNGPALGKRRRISQFAALIRNCINGAISFGTSFSALRPANLTSPSGTAYTPTQLVSGVHWDTLEDDETFDGQIAWEVTRPVPATICALEGFIDTEDR